ncbi:MAG: hypothetical protein LC725_08670, partial [Lentisphaerae bacterium]|nr:hypothetical protein [Lentisphaerota bacterium]
ERSYPGIIRCEFDITGQTILPWLLEYYMTGDEYAMELTRMVEEAYRKHWDFKIHQYSTSDLHALALLYSLDWDETFGDMARRRAAQCIDLDNPAGIDDKKRHGTFYKFGTDLLPLYEYYWVTGDETARKAVLRGVDYMYRLGDRPHTSSHLTTAMSGQNYIAVLFAIAYRWTGNPDYLRVVNDQVTQGVERMRDIHPGVNNNQYFTLNLPAALEAFADAEGPIEPFPVLSLGKDDVGRPILFTKEVGKPVTLGMYVRLSDREHEDAVPRVVVETGGSEIPAQMEVEKAFRTRTRPIRFDARGSHVRLTVPTHAPAGTYTLRFPNAEKVMILDSDAGDIRQAPAPSAQPMQGSN